MATTARTRQTRRETPHTTRSGSCRWTAGREDAKARLQGGLATALRITSDTGDVTDYFVVPQPGHGWRLVKIGDDECTAYDLPLDCSACSCPDTRYRGCLCKHRKALKAALAVLNLI